MSMKSHKVKQGSADWHALRDDDYFTASNAPAMMGASPYKSRPALMAEMKGGAKEVISEQKQALFDKGHAAEEDARYHLELDTLMDWPALVGTIEIDGLRLLASFDGLVVDWRAWEHKLWNAILAENVRNNVLEPKNYWQLEHQALVAGVNEVLFTVSDGTIENCESMIYVSQPERRQAIIDGWKQFNIDLETFEVEAKQELIPARAATQLPIITFKMEGSKIITNLGDIIPQLEELSSQEMSLVLETDQDFATKAAFNKSVKDGRAKLKQMHATAQGEFKDWSKFAENVAAVDSILQKLQSHGEGQVKTDKAKSKAKIIEQGEEAVFKHANECSVRILPASISDFVENDMNFLESLKGMSSLDKMRDKIDAEVAEIKIRLTNTADLVAANMLVLRDLAKDHEFLFNDFREVINQSTEAFKAIVKIRISDYEAEQEEKREAELEKIRKEEAAKAAADAAIKSFNEDQDWVTNCNAIPEYQSALERLQAKAPSTADAETYGDHFGRVTHAYGGCKRAIEQAMQTRQEELDAECIEAIDKPVAEPVAEVAEVADPAPEVAEPVAQIEQGRTEPLFTGTATRAVDAIARDRAKFPDEFYEALGMWADRWYLNAESRSELDKLLHQYL